MLNNQYNHSDNLFINKMLEKIREERLSKISKLRELGKNPFPSKGKRTHYNKDIIENFSKLENKKVYVVGRIMSYRDIGKLIFIKIQDFSGPMQIFIRRENLNKDVDLHFFDIGDFVQAEGTVIKTKTGEISVEAQDLMILSKAIRPLPEKWKGIQDIETRLRRRYLDMTMNPENKELFLKKETFWNSMRGFLQKEGFVEINTPILEHTTGGADANPFITHHNALDIDIYLRISLELPLKKAIGTGFDKVFEIGPVFRNEGMDDEHLQEIGFMEFYWAYENYEAGMNLVQEMYKKIAMDTIGTYKFKRLNFNVDLEGEWEKIDYAESIKKTFNIDIFSTTENELKNKLASIGLEFEPYAKKQRLVDILWKQVRKDISGPAFLINHPTFISPLAKKNPNNPEITERYQVVMCGTEMGNGYSELNDPIDQYNRFAEQQRMRNDGDNEAQMMEIDFVEMLEYGMPPVNGFGTSERLFSFFNDLPIRQCVMFPLMKQEIDKTTSELYAGDRALFDPDFASENYDYKTKKIVAVIDEKLTKGLAMNALGHLSVSIGNKLSKDWMGKSKIEDADGFTHTGISKYPYIVLKASEKELRQLVKLLRASKDVVYADYSDVMFKTGKDSELIKKMGNTKESSIKYAGVIIAGGSVLVESYTQGFKLY